MPETGWIGHKGFDDGKTTPTAELIQRLENGATLVTQTISQAMESRRIRIDAAGDMPTVYTTASDVQAKMVKMSGFSSTATRISVRAHVGIVNPGVSTASGNGPVCDKFLITVNAPDDATAVTRLTYVDLTGGGVSTAGVADTFMVSLTNPTVDVATPSGTYITRVDAVAIPSNTSITPTNIIPTFLDVLVFG